MENLYVFKGNRAKKLTKEFPDKSWGCEDWTNFWKKCKKQARKQDEAAALKPYRKYLVFLVCNIYRKIQKEYVIWLQIFLAAIGPNTKYCYNFCAVSRFFLRSAHRVSDVSYPNFFVIRRWRFVPGVSSEVWVRVVRVGLGSGLESQRDARVNETTG